MNSSNLTSTQFYGRSLVEESVMSLNTKRIYVNEKPKVIKITHSRIFVECGNKYKDLIPCTYTHVLNYQTGIQCYEYIDNKETRLSLILSGLDIPDNI